MKPSIIFESLSNDGELNGLGINSNRIFEAQSVDSRPASTGYFIVISGDEVLFSSVSSLEKGPRTFVIAVHTLQDETRDYDIIDKILFRVSQIFSDMENVSGVDGCRVSQVRCRGRSGNLTDEGWKTITRTSTYGVLYQEIPA